MFEWLATYHESLTVLGNAVAGVAVAAWAVYLHFDARRAAKEAAKPAPPQPPQPILLFGLQPQDLLAALQREAAGTAELQRQLQERDAKITELTKLFQELQASLAPQALDTNVFPASLRVRTFIKGRELSAHPLTGPVLRGILIAVGVFFSGGIAFFVANLGAHWILALILGGLAYYTFFSALYVRFNLTRRTVDLIGPGSASWGRLPRPVQVVSQKSDRGWSAEAKAEGLTLARTDARPTEAEARAELLPFARVLNWEMGIPVVTTDWPPPAKPPA